MPRAYSRKLRVGAELQRLLNELLYADVKDPRLAGVTVTEVQVSGDLGVAKVYYSTLDPDQDVAEIAAAFRKGAGFLRSRIGHSLQLRRVPELHFVHDLSARRGAELSRLIDEAQGGPAEDRSAEGSGPREDDRGLDDDDADDADGVRD